MNVSFGKKIYELRKSYNFTQEELAELLNVSNAAVSKWESGISYPDITLLPNLATIFKISIDSLLGFDLKNETLKELKEVALELNRTGKYIEVIDHLETALIKFPNDFDLNLLMGRTLMSGGLNKKEQDFELVTRSLKYFDKALFLDTKGKHKESIIQNKSFALSSLGKYAEANELLLSLNSNKYIVQIADNYIKMGEFEKGMNLLQNHLNDFAFSFASLSFNLAKCFEKLNRQKEALELIKLTAIFREYFTNSGKSNYYNFLVSRDYLDVAKFQLKLGNTDEMFNYLEKAIMHAARFDEDQNYNVSDVNFLFGLEGQFNNGGVKAMPFVIKTLNEEFIKFCDDPRYIELMKKVNK